MRAGFNPARRNRNIGTAKQGHGQNNKLVIPTICAGEREWYEQLNAHQCIQRVVSGREIIFLVEETHAGFVHSCTVEDVRHVLAHIPLADWEGLDTFVLRQSSRKQRTLRPAWGRMFYSADLGLPTRRPSRLGPAVMLEAMECGGSFEWPTSLQPDDMAELDRLRDDGHEIAREGRRFIVSMTPKSVRATQLYRTLLHEIGHWVDYLEKVERPANSGAGDFSALSDAYFARPRSEREAFAHRYAETSRRRLTEAGVLPFAPIPLLTGGRAASGASRPTFTPTPE